jgi:hypothetical protein
LGASDSAVLLLLLLVMFFVQIGVFKHDANDQLEYLNKIPAVKSLSGDLFSPTKAILHERDSKILLLDAARENTVSCMDLERGQVIEEWNVSDGGKIRNFAPKEKYAQLTNEKGVLGVNKNSVFELDPRLNTKNKMATHYTYADAHTRRAHSCISPDG